MRNGLNRFPWLASARALPVVSWVVLASCALVVAAASTTAAWALGLMSPGATLPHGGGETVTVLLLIVLRRGAVGAQFLGGASLVCSALAGLACAFAARIVIRSPEAAANRQMAGLLVAAAAMLLLRVLPDLVASRFGNVPLFDKLQFLAGFSLALYLLLGLARFLVLFPRIVDAESIEKTYLRGRPVARVLGRVGPVIPFSAMRAWHAALVGGWPLWLAALLPFLAWAAHGPVRAFVAQDLWAGTWVFLSALSLVAYFGFGLPFAIASTAHVRRFGTEDERRRVALLRALLLALLCAIAFTIVMALVVAQFIPEPTGKPSPVAASGAIELGMAERLLFAFGMFWLFIPEIAVVCAAVAVLRGGALDPRVAFSRGALWSAVGMIVTLLFVLLERFMTQQVSRWLDLGSDSGALLAGALVAGSFMPIRDFVSRGVDALAKRLVPLQEAAQGERLRLAVAVVDISGYTALSARDENQAILQGAALGRVSDQVAARYSGHRVKGLGDAALLVFADAAGAAAALREIHQRFPEMVRALGIDPLPLHSGCHFGEIVRSSDGDVFGQTVNLAARLVDAAAPGQILMSATACASLPSAMSRESVGPKRFKNLAEPVECFRLA